MSTRELSLAQQRELAATWRQTGRLLDAMRRAELAAQTPEQSRQAAYDMLQLGGMLPSEIARDQKSGLVEMQRVFARWHTRGRF